MKRALILALFLILSKSTGYCTSQMFPPLQPLGTAPIQDYTNNITSLPDPFVQTKSLNTANSATLNQVEQTLFGRSYQNQNATLRLSRIEKNLFSTTYPNATNEQRIDNIISNFNQMNKYPNISTNSLSRLESKVLKQTFPNYSTQRRIERLEEEMLGTIQSGDLTSRYERLMLAAKNYNKNQYAQNILIPQQSGWKGLASTIGDSFWGGTMTGFTPPINPVSGGYNYGGYNNGYQNSYSSPFSSAYTPGSGMYRGVRTNHGYSDSFTDYGSSTGVTILD